jgi:hypothetical protein
MESYILHCSSWSAECDSAKMLRNGFFHDTNEIIFWQRENKNCHSQLCLNVLLLHVLIVVEIHYEVMEKILQEGLFLYNPLEENLIGCM